MTITLTYAWWWIPAIITFIALILPFVFSDDGGAAAGITFALLLISALFVVSLAWTIGGIFK